MLTCIIDYFNYGFDEFTWTQYCLRQQNMSTAINAQKQETKQFEMMLAGQPGPAGAGGQPAPMPMGMPGMPDMPPDMMNAMFASMQAQNVMTLASWILAVSCSKCRPWVAACLPCLVCLARPAKVVPVVRVHMAVSLCSHRIQPKDMAANNMHNPPILSSKLLKALGEGRPSHNLKASRDSRAIVLSNLP